MDVDMCIYLNSYYGLRKIPEKAPQKVCKKYYVCWVGMRDEDGDGREQKAHSHNFCRIV